MFSFQPHIKNIISKNDVFKCLKSKLRSYNTLDKEKQLNSQVFGETETKY